MVEPLTNHECQVMLGTLLPRVEPTARVEDAWQIVSRTFESALAELSAEERVYLKMRLLHGCTVNEIARAFHVDESSFRRRFRHLLKTLRRLIVVVPSQYH